jgi:hypothetical protein
MASTSSSSSTAAVTIPTFNLNPDVANHTVILAELDRLNNYLAVADQGKPGMGHRHLAQSVDICLIDMILYP